MAAAQRHVFHGLEIPVRSFAGARALRIVHPGGQVIRPHRHDWPLLTLPALGGYEEECEDGVVAVSGPAAVIHPAGCCHANCIHAKGMETFSIEFDPAWLAKSGMGVGLDRSHYWIGGVTALQSRALMRLWSAPAAGEALLQQATAEFLVRAMQREPIRLPVWQPRLREMLARDDNRGAAELAREFGMHPVWLAHAYRNAAGEGLHEMRRRRRVEKAVDLLRSTSEPIAQIAATVGFCDQSHLNRSVRSLTGRTPMQIRAEGDQLRQLVAS